MTLHMVSHLILLTLQVLQFRFQKTPQKQKNKNGDQKGLMMIPPLKVPEQAKRTDGDKSQDTGYSGLGVGWVQAEKDQEGNSRGGRILDLDLHLGQLHS